MRGWQISKKSTIIVTLAILVMVFGAGFIAVGPALKYTFFNPAVCFYCHHQEEKNWQPPNFDHGHCLNCHNLNLSMLGSPPPTEFLADSEAVNRHCRNCHHQIGQITENTPQNAEKKTAIKSSILFSHRIHLVEVEQCTDCHYNIAHDRGDPGTGRPPKKLCHQCHMLDIERPVDDLSCQRCHQVRFIR